MKLLGWVKGYEPFMALDFAWWLLKSLNQKVIAPGVVYEIWAYKSAEGLIVLAVINISGLF